VKAAEDIDGDGEITVFDVTLFALWLVTDVEDRHLLGLRIGTWVGGEVEVDGNPFLFNSQYFDWENGLYYQRARYYNPTIGRWLTADFHWNIHNMVFGDDPQDPLGLGRYVPDIYAIMQSGNLYVYCLNNPVLWSDSSGLFVRQAWESFTDRQQANAERARTQNILFAMETYQRLGIGPDDPRFFDLVIEMANTFEMSMVAALGSAGKKSGLAGKSAQAKRSLTLIRGNTQANKIAQQHGFRGAEDLKRSIVGRDNISLFNIHRDTKTGELILKSIRGNIQIPTGLFD